MSTIKRQRTEAGPSRSQNGLDHNYAQCSAIQWKLKALNPETEMSSPCFICIGAQKSGKSTLLNNLLGREIFPNRSGTDAKTEMPKTLANISILALTCDSYTINDGPVLTSQDFDREIKEILKTMNVFCETDCRHIKVTGPDLYNVHLIDTPGPANCSDSELQTYLNTSYLKAVKANDSARVLWTIEAGKIETDILLSHHGREVLTNERVHIIMTKPDKLSYNDDVLYRQLSNGYQELPKERIWCVKNYDTASSNEYPSLREQRRLETQYFREHHYYNALSPEDKKRCGINNLKEWMVNYIIQQMKIDIEKNRPIYENLLAIKQQELLSIGQPIPLENSEERMCAYTSFFTEWPIELNNKIQGSAGQHLRVTLKNMRTELLACPLIINDAMLEDNGGFLIPVNRLNQNLMRDILGPHLRNLHDIAERWTLDLHRQVMSLITEVKPRSYSRLDASFWKKVVDIIKTNSHPTSILDYIKTHIDSQDILTKPLDDRDVKYQLKTLWSSITENVADSVWRVMSKFYSATFIQKTKEILENNKHLANDIQEDKAIIKRIEDIKHYRSLLQSALTIIDDING